VGTVEEILYLLSILMHPDNSEAIPLVLAGPESCRNYFQELEQFLLDCLGEEVKHHYRVIVGDPEEVGRTIKSATDDVHARRRAAQQAYYFNWELQIPADLQQPFTPTHERMAALQLTGDLPKYQLASNLRCAFSGLVAGNIKTFGMEQVRQYGPYKLSGDRKYLSSLDRLLQVLVKEKRMKLGEADYQPCYQLVD
jgi:pyrimidine/purine-5'-nucleotide nucleosidase